MWKVPAWLTAWLTVLRDVLATGAGLWGVIHEELSSHADLSRMAFFALMMIAPGAIARYWQMTQQPPDTGVESSASPGGPSPPPPSFPSSNAQPGSPG